MFTDNIIPLKLKRQLANRIKFPILSANTEIYFLAVITLQSLRFPKMFEIFLVFEAG
jgi:hypothetical protein